jgi:DNA-binding HxlR family transcriptional regulator
MNKSDSDAESYIWYATYGSNLLKEPFMCYLEGRVPPKCDAGTTIQGDHPFNDQPFRLPFKLYFAREKSKWDHGGVAFLETIYLLSILKIDMAAEIEIAAQSTRLLLLKALLNGPSYPSELENELNLKGVERKAISFHLKKLEEYGLVEGKYEIGKDRPVTLYMYKITARGKAVYNHIMAFK